MKIELLLFATSKELFGQSKICIDLPTGANVADLKAALINREPNSATMIQRCAFSVDHQYATDATELRPEFEIAMIPPVSGG